MSKSDKGRLAYLQRLRIVKEDSTCIYSHTHPPSG
jgi:hypothetical protein